MPKFDGFSITSSTSTSSHIGQIIGRKSFKINEFYIQNKITIVRYPSL